MSTGSDGMLHNWNLEFEKPISSASIGSTAINDVSISSQSEFMSATVGHDGFCRLWDSRLLDKGCVQISVLNQIGTAVSWSGRVESNCFAGLADGTICCIDWRAGGHVDKQKLHNGRINRLRMASACAPDGGSLFVTSSDDKTSKLCIERNGTALAEDECISECAALPIVRY